MGRHKHKHHGGAWKVAYADFVTAMMALFLVLWLTAQDTKIKEAIARSFSNPFTSLTKESTGIIPNTNKFQSAGGPGGKDSSPFSSVVELNMLRQANQDLLRSLPEEAQDTIKVETTPEGLRISIFDRSRKPIFKPDSTELTDYGNWVFSTLAWEIARYKDFRLDLEGHTEAGHVPPRPDYGNWELSTDRANVARRKLLNHGVETSQINKVAGYADTQPMANLQPEDEANRRVTVMLKINPKKPGH